MVNKAPTSLTYTGPASVSSGQTLTLTSVLTTCERDAHFRAARRHDAGSRQVGRRAAPDTTNSSGVASCTITVNQVEGSVAVTASYGGSSYYQSSSGSSSEKIGCGGGGAVAVVVAVAAVAVAGCGRRLGRRLPASRRWLRRGLRLTPCTPAIF